MMDRSATLPVDQAQLARLLEELRAEARTRRFETAPNPAVGAAVLSGGRVVGRGFHSYWGGAHAEVEAIVAARANGVPPEAWDTLVVTLEPCSTQGKTPPCTDLILASGIRRVVAGAVDPDPRHRGRGLELLASKGLEVEVLPLSAPLDAHFESWVSQERTRRPRPWTIAKWAQTRTGQLAPPPHIGDGRWISSPESLREVQLLRGRVDAIVTGVGTVLSDNPRFSVRPPGNAEHPPRRVVLDGHLRTPPDARLFAQALLPGEGAGAVTILCRAGQSANAAARRGALVDAGAEIIGMPTGETGDLDLRDVQTWLFGEGHRRVLIEAGPRLLEGYLASGFVDQVRVYTGDVNGGRGRSMAEWFAQLELTERLDREVAGDAVLEGFPRVKP
jgi:diaminohydroxyphosphoribosylaminopyrimidine deaminase/5-amino-6-(5-phosphoribosylamino)uracil reductase